MLRNNLTCKRKLNEENQFTQVEETVLNSYFLKFIDTEKFCKSNYKLEVAINKCGTQQEQEVEQSLDNFVESYKNKFFEKFEFSEEQMIKLYKFVNRIQNKTKNKSPYARLKGDLGLKCCQIMFFTVLNLFPEQFEKLKSEDFYSNLKDEEKLDEIL